MKPNVLLTVLSVLSILLLTLHFTDDTLHAKVGNPEAGGSTLVTVPVLAVWLYATLVLGERLVGRIVMLLGSIIAIGMPIIHAIGKAGLFTGQIAKSDADYLFVWTLHALGVIGICSFILSIRELLRLKRRRPPAM